MSGAHWKLVSRCRSIAPLRRSLLSEMFSHGLRGVKLIPVGASQGVGCHAALAFAGGEA